MNDENEPIPDTDIPPPHGFLEQFEVFSAIALDDLKHVVELGLSPPERFMLIKVSLKLLTISMQGAKEADFSEEIKSELEALITDLDTCVINLSATH